MRNLVIILLGSLESRGKRVLVAPSLPAIVENSIPKVGAEIVIVGSKNEALDSVSNDTSALSRSSR